MSEYLTNERLAEIEAGANGVNGILSVSTNATLALVAEVRRMRSLFTKEDVIACEVAGNWLDARCNDPEGKRQLDDLARRLRAIGEPEQRTSASPEELHNSGGASE